MVHGSKYFGNKQFIRLQVLIRYSRSRQHLKASFNHLRRHLNLKDAR
jgi:hypothetical protein